MKGFARIVLLPWVVVAASAAEETTPAAPTATVKDHTTEDLTTLTAQAEGREPAQTDVGTAKPEAAPAAETNRRYTLAEFVKAAETNGSGLAEQNAQVLFAEARASLARAKAYPTGKLDIFVGPTPGAVGDPVTGTTDREKWGVATGVKADITQPIFTFGALSSAREAANAGIEAEKQLLERDRWKLRTQIHEFYHGFQLAFELAGVAEDLREKLEEALQKGEDMRRNNRSRGPSAGDLDKLRIYLSEVRVRESEAKKGLEQARAAMAWKIGTYGQTTPPKWDRANLQRREIRALNIDEAQRMARESRPELKAMEHDVRARAALVGTERSQLLPSIFVGASFAYTVASVRENQFSPFAYDPLNDVSGGLIAGVRWNLGFFERSATLSMARAELIKSEGRLKHLGQGIFVEVEKNLRDYEHEKRSLELRKEGSQAAKRIFVDNAVAFNLGTGKAQGLLEAVGAYAQSERARFENVYNHNLAAARLEQALGVDLSLDAAAPAVDAKK